MKKKIAAALAVTFALGVTSAFAANPFVDVPAKHWAYDAVSKLAQAGIVDGYGDGTFRGDKNITRYEMAQIVAKALAKEDKANAEQKALLNKLSAEFSEELDNLGVRVSKLEKNASSVKITADARLRYKTNEDVNSNTNKATTDNKFANRLRLYIDGTVSNDVSFAGRLSAENGTIANDGSVSDNNSTAVDYANFTYKNVFNNVSISAGRFPLTLGYGLLSGSTGGYDAVQASFGGDKVKGWVAYGDNSIKASKANTVTSAYVPGTPTAPAIPAVVGGKVVNGNSDANVLTYNFTYNPSKSFQALTSGYISTDSAYKYQVYSLGFKGKISPVFTLTGEYAINQDAPSNKDDKAYFAQLGYKGADRKAPHSFGIFAQYWKAGNGAIDQSLPSLPVFEALTGDAFIREYGIKSIGYGFNYAFTKNGIFTVTYQDLEGYNGQSRPDYGYARAEFWF